MKNIVTFFTFPEHTVAPMFKFVDIFDWTDDVIEHKHDYIQWYFPLTEMSVYHVDSPVLDIEQLKYLHNNKKVKKLQAKAFHRMLDFYGFKKWIFWYTSKYQWYISTPSWVNPGLIDHNYLRITRILTSLYLLGNNKLADKFLAALIVADLGYYVGTGRVCIPIETKEYWKGAKARAEEILKSAGLI